MFKYNKSRGVSPEEAREAMPPQKIGYEKHITKIKQRKYFKI